jgi:DNA polymerase-3 subunit chi
MTEVWFYLLADATEKTHTQFITRFCNTAYRREREAVILCRDMAQAQTLNLAIWGYQAESFIPHSIDWACSAPLQLITQSLPAQGDILLNLTDQLLTVTGYQRIVEIINPDNRDASRGRWRHYQQQGLSPELKPI